MAYDLQMAGQRMSDVLDQMERKGMLSRQAHEPLDSEPIEERKRSIQANV